MRKTMLIVLITTILLLASCTPKGAGTSDRIVSPQNKLIPIYGEWKIDSFNRDASLGFSEEDLNKWIGKTAVFHEKIAVLGGESCTDPVYKIKNVNTTDYLLYQYKVNLDNLGIKSPKIQVVTVTSKNQFFYEFIKTGDNEIIANIDGVFYHFKKVSGNIDKAYVDKLYEKDKAADGTDRLEDDRKVYSGILLGLKSYKKTGNKVSDREWTYRTLWIPGRSREIGKIYETEGLFVPRKTGFWKMGIRNESVNGYSQDIMFAYPADKEIHGSQVEARSTAAAKANIFRTILYVGNDYVSTEYKAGSDSAVDTLFQVLPIDNIENAKAVKISDIVGEAGKGIINDGITRYFASNPGNRDKYSYAGTDEENFAVVRRNGHWVMKGRLNSIDGKSPFIDFNINAIPPSSLVTYDELCLSWSGVKEKIPEAVDMYTSPNNDIAIIITNNNILIYSIEGKELSYEPLRKIRLKDKETVVMGEWSSGSYTDKWEREFLKNKAVEIKE